MLLDSDGHVKLTDFGELPLTLPLTLTPTPTLTLPLTPCPQMSELVRALGEATEAGVDPALIRSVGIVSK